MRVLRFVRQGLVVLALLLAAAAVVAAATVGWLLVTSPKPRPAEAWSLGPALRLPRGELAMAVGHAVPCPVPPCPAAERLYVVGGLSDVFRPRRSVSVYDPNAKVWSGGPPLPSPRHHLAAAALDQTLYVSGGTDVAGVQLGHQHWPPTDSFWRLTLPAGRWASVGKMIEPRWGHRMVAHDGRLYVVGGRGPSARVLIYAPERGWSFGAEMPSARDHLSVVAVDGRIWAIGGRDPGSLPRVDIYDPKTDSWESGPELPSATSGAAEGVVDGVVFIYGGEEPSFLGGGINDRHWMLDTRRSPRRWQPAPPPPLTVHGTSGAVLQGGMVIAGGSTRHGALTLLGWSDALQLMHGGAVRR
jgi:hypothetical protein